MERTMLSDEEKIKRAIEISQRRNFNNINTERIPVKKEKTIKINLFKRMILQITICLLIYYGIYIITSTNYIFSENFLNKAEEILNYDINVMNIYETLKKQFQKINLNLQPNNEKSNSETYVTNKIEENEMNIIENVLESTLKNEITLMQLNQIEIKEDTKNNELKKEKTQMELDAEQAKGICSFIKPLNGKITSEFGERESTSKIVSTDHKGIDISANKGSKIKSSISGNVEVASENSEYGKFIKITNYKVMTVYAHCETLKVKKGQKIKQGDVIATVGSTGNSTGPHLHFEIRLDGRFINPRYILDF